MELFRVCGYRLAPNSQAVNKGDNNRAEAAGLILSPFTRDLAGNRRFVGASIDIGAYEFDASAFAGDLVVTTLCDWQDATLTVNGKTDPFDSALSLYLDENELMW